MIEALEDRLVPTAFAPLAGTADGAAGSLRAAVIAANGNGQDKGSKTSDSAKSQVLSNKIGDSNKSQGDKGSKSTKLDIQGNKNVAKLPGFKSDPKRRLNLARLVLWWFVTHVRGFLMHTKKKLRGQRYFPPSLLLGELFGAAVGLFGGYARSQRRVERIRRQFPVLPGGM